MITGYLCPQGKVRFEDCLAECAAGSWPPCEFPYSILAGMARFVRGQWPSTEVSVTETCGCLTQKFLERTTADVYVRPAGMFWRFRGQIAHEVAAGYPMPGAMVEQRLRVRLNGDERTISGKPDALEPMGLHGDVPEAIGLPKNGHALMPLLVGDGGACAFCGAYPILEQPAFRVRLEGATEDKAALCGTCFRELRDEGLVLWRLLDFKTTRYVPKEVRPHHERQLSTYIALAYFSGYTVGEIRVVYMDMGMQRTLPMRVDGPKVANYWQTMALPQAERLIAALQAGTLPQPGPLHELWECKYCDLAGACPYKNKKEFAAAGGNDE